MEKRSPNRQKRSAREQENLIGFDLSMPGRPFDPTELVQLAREQLNQLPGMAVLLERCTHEWPETEEELYTSFLPPMVHHKFRHVGGFLLHHPLLGELLFDLVALEGPNGPELRVLGMEYITRVMAPDRYTKAQLQVVWVKWKVRSKRRDERSTVLRMVDHRMNVTAPRNPYPC